eukprot:sb/3473537/
MCVNCVIYKTPLRSRYHGYHRHVTMVTMVTMVTSSHFVPPKKKGNISPLFVTFYNAKIGEGSSETENVWFRSVDHVMFPAATLSGALKDDVCHLVFGNCGFEIGMRCNPLVCAAAAPRNEGIEANAAHAFVLSSKQSKITLRSRIRRCL